jgi:hypothetical protein
LQAVLLELTKHRSHETILKHEAQRKKISDPIQYDKNT